MTEVKELYPDENRYDRIMELAHLIDRVWDRVELRNELLKVLCELISPAYIITPFDAGGPGEWVHTQKL